MTLKENVEFEMWNAEWEAGSGWVCGNSLDFCACFFK